MFDALDAGDLARVGGILAGTDAVDLENVRAEEAAPVEVHRRGIAHDATALLADRGLQQTALLAVPFGWVRRHA